MSQSENATMTSQNFLRYLDVDSIEISNISNDNDVDTVISAVTEPSHQTNISNRKLIGRCLITIFPSEADERLLHPESWFDNPVDVISIWCGQFEICEKTGLLHGHIYIEFKRKRYLRFEALRKLIETVTGKSGDIKIPRTSSKDQRQGAVNYVLADEKRAENTSSYIWPYNTTTVAFNQVHWDARKDKKKSSSASKKEEVEEQRVWIESKPKHWTWDQIVHENEQSKMLLATCGWGQKYHAGRHASTPRRKIEHVVILYGAGGTGKTTLAHKWDTLNNEDFEERYYRRNHDDGNFWGGGRTAYRGQRIIHLEEFCGQEPFSRIKEICDIGKEGPSVNIKNSGTELNHNTVLITSNHHPAAWYRNLWSKEHKQFHPFWRRVTQVWFFPELRPDGTRNIPTTDLPPFYIDQTDDWKALNGNYEQAVQHASSHWAMPLIDETYTVSRLTCDSRTGRV